jgi:hypothetical protein
MLDEFDEGFFSFQILSKIIQNGDEKYCQNNVVISGTFRVWYVFL